jgi:hypothetical protein
VNEDLRIRLLGRGDRDQGCEAGIAIVDQYVEAVVRGDDAERLFPEIVAHMAGCAACREDIEGLIVAVRRDVARDEPK